MKTEVIDLTHNELAEWRRNGNERFNNEWIASRNLKFTEIIKSDNQPDVGFHQKIDSSPFMVVWLKNIDRLMDMTPNSFDPQDFALCDVGCGSGVSTLYFLENYQFASFSGFDFSADLIRKARINLTRYNRKSTDPVDFFVQNASSYMAADRRMLFFMFNPFGWSTMRAWLENNISNLKTHKSVLAYANDVCAESIEPYGTRIVRDSKYNLSIIFF